MNTPGSDGPPAPGDSPVDLPDVVALAVDGSGRITWWGPRAERLLGRTAAESLGRPLADFLDLPAGHAAAWTGHAGGRHRDGHRIPLGVRVTPLDGTGGTRSSIVSAIDLTGSPWWSVSSAVLDRFLTELPYGIAVLDTELRYVWLNRTLERMAGVPLAHRVGRRVADVLPGLQPEAMEEQLRHALETGEPVLGFEYRGHTPADTERERVYATSFFRLDDRDGRTLGVCYMGTDVTERQRAQDRLSLLTASGSRIGRSLDIGRTAEELTVCGVPALADFIAVDLFPEVLRGDEPAAPGGGAPRLVRVAHRSVREGTPEAAVAVGEPSGYTEDSPAARSITEGAPVLRAVVDPDGDGWPSGELVRVERVREFGLRSAMAVPIRARGACLGVVLLLRGRGSERFEPADLPLAAEFVSRAALALDNARRYTRERLASVTLQRSLLPKLTRGGTTMDVAARYRPARGPAGAGGDWFDAIPLSGARVALVAGDVVGHGLAAAAAMGRLRMAVRTLAGTDLPPEELLAHLDDLVLRLIDEEAEARTGGAAGVVGEVVGGTADRAGYGPSDDTSAAAAVLGASCLYVVYDPVDRSCVMARAGHPAPALVAPDGTVTFADLPGGPPLGLGSLPFEAHRTTLPEGTVIALYTDGLLTGPDRDPGAGQEALRAVLGEHPGSPLDDLCERTLAALPPGPAADDAALLLARTHVLGQDRVASWDLLSDPAVVREARAMAVRTLRAWGLEELELTTELVVSELVTNAVRYGGEPIRLRLLHDTFLVCEVADGSSTSPRLRHARITDEGGRGLFMVAQMTRRWGTRYTDRGKVIWAEQQPGAVPDWGL
ncbi:PAS domain S-box-containing protein [Streptomyces sp. TLI_053]|uniref:SpoIIE family protein phosphatase n=1 Tax=Streptomyces sp. TLI_053 TaxID=1855352 RepID=UPI00087AAE44|nr:SpoIIE family protein phosphatase [Streptomyces sp. TLI_053]SDT08387.1 PAS domain S-box-containing protein [Streptomyces sp. TLI_053]